MVLDAEIRSEGEMNIPLEFINVLQPVEVPPSLQRAFIDKLEKHTLIRCTLVEFDTQAQKSTIDLSLREVPTPGGSYNRKDLASAASGKLHEVEESSINPN